MSSNILRRAKCPVLVRLSTGISENLHGRARQAPCKKRPVINTSQASNPSSIRASRSGASFPQMLSVFTSHISLSCLEAGLQVSKPPCNLPQALPAPRKPPAKVFGREGCGEGEPFSKKVSLPASISLFKSSSACLPSPNKKIPGGAGTKKDPLAL